MKISLIQTSIEWLNASANRVSAEEWIKRCQGSTLCVLPEMFSTGFCMNPTQNTTEWRQTLEWMKEMAAKYQLAVAGSVAVEEGGRYYNRLYVVHKCGKVEKYDKHHLFTFAGEHNNYTAGDERVIITIEGVRILLLVCYDLRFPVWIRNHGDYDAIVCVANWPSPRRGAWDTLLKARAIENLSYVCGVNIVGEDSTCQYSGGTVALNFLGEDIQRVEDNKKGIATVDIDLAALAEFRAKFPALNDGEKFEII